MSQRRGWARVGGVGCFFIRVGSSELEVDEFADGGHVEEDDDEEDAEGECAEGVEEEGGAEFFEVPGGGGGREGGGDGGAGAGEPAVAVREGEGGDAEDGHDDELVGFDGFPEIGGGGC